MKKLFLMLAAATFAANASAQGTAITSNKAGDNWYVGVNAGVATRVKESFDGAGNGFFKSMAPTVGVRVGKNLTTVFGLAAEGNVFTQTNEKWANVSGKTFIEALNVNLLGTFNLNNLFAGYQGEPRAFEVIALGGFGWDHAFNHASKGNGLSSKAALDFAFNLGAAKAIQLYIEPSINYSLIQSGGVFNDIKYDLNRSYFAIKAGLNYKFGNSNGTHNFAKAKINELRSESSAKDGKLSAANRTISDLQAQLTACQNKPAPTAKVQVVKETTQLQPIVIFGVGKSTLDNAGYASCEMVAKYMRNHKDTKIIVKGYASPEGDAAKNQKLSEARANAVKNALVKRYKIAADRIEAQGLGATSEISEENDFNRVAMFFTK